MNWIGGARNRIKYQGEKKIQKEFFDRKRIDGLSNSFLARTSGKKKHGISQDLMALHTVSKTHSQLHSAGTTRQPIKFIDLEKFKSCTRSIEEVDLGPCSPNMTPSKVFIPGKTSSDQKTSWQLPNISSTSTEKSTQETACESLQQPKMTSGGNERQSRSYSQLNKTECSQSRQPETSRSKSNCIERSTSTVRHNADKTSCPHFRFAKLGTTTHVQKSFKFDPYATEDFQMTPVVKYHKGNSKSIIAPDNKHQKHRKVYKEMPQLDNNDSKSVSDINNYFTSTPVNIAERNRKENKLYTSFNSSFGKSLSPIKRKSHVPHEDYEFKYRPRPMIYLSDNMDLESEKMNYDKMKISKIQNPVEEQLPRGDSHICGQENAQKQATDCWNSSSDSLDETLPTESNKPCVGHSSFSGGKIYANCSNEKKVAGNSFNECEWLMNIHKPVFTDLADDFRFQPVKKRSSFDTTLNLMKYSNKEEISVKADIMTRMDDVSTAGIMDKTLDTRKSSGGSMNVVCSPETADEFPYHLQSSIPQVLGNVARTLKDVTAETADDLVISNQCEKNRYRPVAVDLEDVLKEMRDLEEQNMSRESLVCSDSLQLPPGVNASESFEAEKYVESEEFLLKEAKTAYTKQLEVNLKEQNDIGWADDQINREVDTSKIEDATIVYENNSQQNFIGHCQSNGYLDKGHQSAYKPELATITIPKSLSETEISNNTEKILNTKSAKVEIISNSSNAIKYLHTCEETSVANVVKNNTDNLVTLQDGDETLNENYIATKYEFANSEDKNVQQDRYCNAITNSDCKDTNDVENIFSDSCENGKDVSNENYIDTDINNQLIGQTDKSVFETEGMSKIRFDDENKCIYSVLKPECQQKRYGDVQSNIQHKQQITAVMIQSEMQLQNVPDFMSVNDRYSMTTSEMSNGENNYINNKYYYTSKQFVDTSTSPIHTFMGNNDKTVEYCSTGIQCDLRQTCVPKLSQLAGDSIRVKPARKRRLLKQYQSESDSTLLNGNEVHTPITTPYVDKLVEVVYFRKQRKMSRAYKSETSE